MTTQKIADIMEVTLRDGSYVIDFQFTAEDTAVMVTALEAAGFDWIEVGHGLGLNASEHGKRRAMASDEEHLHAASSAVKKAKWGMFFIPGIGRHEDIALAAKYGMSFIRVGTNITDAHRAEPFIKQAKELGMIVCYNAMKSYAVTPEAFAKVAKQTRDWGADMVYVVDSAGTMMPEDVTAFVHAIKAVTDAPIGFHGHDNLSMGMANTLAAIEAGAAIVDASLRGMGRSAGNVITEALVASMQRRGHWREIDLKQVMDISAGLIAPLVPGRGLDTMAITAGMAGFHSSFTDKVRSYADKYDIDIRDLILRLCELDRINAPDDVLQQLSVELAAQKRINTTTLPAFGVRPTVGNPPRTLEDILKRLYSEATKRQTFSALDVVFAESPLESYKTSSNIQSTVSHTIGSVAVSTPEQLAEVLRLADGSVDVIFLDNDPREGLPMPAIELARPLVQSSTLLAYSLGRVWVRAISEQVTRLLDEQINKGIVIVGDHRHCGLLCDELMGLGARVTLATSHDEALPVLKNAEFVVVWHGDEAWFDETLANQLTAGKYVMDAGIGSLTARGIAQAKARGALPIRVNIWPALTGALLSAHSGAIVRTSAMGWGKINEVAVVAGGAIGDEGAVIVDDINAPKRIIGVADGQGGVIMDYNDAQADAVRQVLSAINTRRIEPEV